MLDLHFSRLQRHGRRWNEPWNERPYGRRHAPFRPTPARAHREAIQKWMQVAELEETTRDRYEDLVRLYIAPTFGDFILNAQLLVGVNAAAMARSSTAKKTRPDPPSTEEAARRSCDQVLSGWKSRATSRPGPTTPTISRATRTGQRSANTRMLPA